MHRTIHRECSLSPFPSAMHVNFFFSTYLQQIVGGLILAILCWGPPAHAEPITIVENGHSAFSICCDPAAPHSVKRAVQELQLYIKKVSGADIPLQGTRSAEPFISIGNTPALRRASIRTDDLPQEGYKIITRDGNIFIVGSDTPDGSPADGGGTSTGSLFGTYTFIEKYLGVRWFMPGELGEYVPRNHSIIVPGTHIIDAPDFKMRALPYIQNEKPEVKQWYVRNRLGGSLKLSYGHNWHRVIPAALFEQHPEYFALIGGKRIKPVGSKGHKLCTTNKGLIREYALAAVNYFSRSKGNTTFSLSPSDGRGWCECNECRKLDEIDENGKVFITRRILTFYNEVARLVTAQFPDQYLCGYVYADYMRPPLDRSFSIHPNVKLVLAANYHRKLLTPGERKRWDELLHGWTTLHPLACYHDFPSWFQGDYGQPMPPNKKILKYMFPILKDNNVSGVYMYGIAAWGHGAAFNYIFTRLAWNAHQSVDDLYTDFFLKCYGRSGKNIMAIYNLIEDSLEQYCLQKPKISHISKPALLRDVYAHNFKKIELLYREALEAEPTGKERQRLQMLGDNLVILCRALSLFKLLPEAEKSSFFMLEPAYQQFLKKNRTSLALSPEATQTAFKKRIAPLSVKALDQKPLHAEPLRLYRMRGSQHIVALTTFTGPVTISVQDVTILNGIIEYSVYDADGTRITRGTINQDSIITFNVSAGRYYHLFFDTKQCSFMLKIPDGIYYAIDGTVNKRGVWFIARRNIFPPTRYIPPLYFYVPPEAPSFDLTISSGAPIETAQGRVYDPNNNQVAVLNTANRPQDTARITCTQEQAGIWKIELSPAATGTFEDVWIKFGNQLSGFISIETDKILKILSR